MLYVYSGDNDFINTFSEQNDDVSSKEEILQNFLASEIKIKV